jgi:hypothetical protein
MQLRRQAPAGGEFGVHGRCAPGEGRFVDGGAGPRDGQQVRQVEQFAPAVPGVQFEDRIAAHQPHDGCMRTEFVAQLAQGVDGVGRTVAAEFAPVDDQGMAFVERLVRDGEVEHVRALHGVRVRRALVRRIGGGSRWTSACSASRTARAMARCPVWTGSKVPP